MDSEAISGSNRGETKPSKHHFALRADQRTSLQVRLSEVCKSVRVKRKPKSKITSNLHTFFNCLFTQVNSIQ